LSLSSFELSVKTVKRPTSSLIWAIRFTMGGVIVWGGWRNQSPPSRKERTTQTIKVGNFNPE
ncbi:hypothetical protein ADUPG1_001267, partial [Aduncisulcus paluster]